MNLKEAYNALGEVPTPKQAFIKEIARIAMVSEATALQWLSGTTRPAKVRLKLLADHYECKPEELGLIDNTNEKGGTNDL